VQLSRVSPAQRTKTDLSARGSKALQKVCSTSFAIEKWWRKLRKLPTAESSSGDVRTSRTDSRESSKRSNRSRNKVFLAKKSRKEQQLNLCCFSWCQVFLGEAKGVQVSSQLARRRRKAAKEGENSRSDQGIFFLVFLVFLNKTNQRPSRKDGRAAEQE
jgi:hypothetical protein